MVAFLTKRLAISIIIVAGVLSLSFLIIHLAPGDPASLYLRPDINSETLENVRQQMGLNLPVWQQYFQWLQALLNGNLGVSFSQNRPVIEVFVEALPNTLQLTATVFAIQLIVGLILGVLLAVKQNTALDHALSSLLLFLYSMPGFWLALMAILLFSYKLGWLPASQMTSFDLADGLWANVSDRIQHLILPSMVLAIPFVAHTSRFIRGTLCEVLLQDYIRTAHAYGLKQHTILFKYALKNALLPVTTLLGLYLPFLLGGSVVTEYIFAWPGMGRITVNAILSHDFPIILGSTILAAVTVVMGDLVSDVLSAVVDPRIRVGH